MFGIQVFLSMTQGSNRIATPHLKTFLKLGIAAFLIIWMAYSGRLDLRAIAHASSQWPRLGFIASVFYLLIFILALRWRILAGALGFHLSRKDSFSLTMIGMLFNTVIPGSVGGDVLKAYYAAGGSADRTGPIASIIADRVVGLFSLILLAVIGAAWNFEHLSRHADLRAFWLMLAAALLIAAIFGMLAIAASDRLMSLLAPLRIYPPVRTIILKMLGVLSAYNRKRMALLQALALSLPCHLLACAMFYLCVSAVSDSTLNPRLLLFLVPLGLVTTAVPLAPGGIGVGQAAFYALFHLVLRGQGALGSSAFTIYQLVLLLVSLSGIFFYLRYRGIAAVQHAATGGDS
jgi:hypothetical protein